MPLSQPTFHYPFINILQPGLLCTAALACSTVNSLKLKADTSPSNHPCVFFLYLVPLPLPNHISCSPSIRSAEIDSNCNFNSLIGTRLRVQEHIHRQLFLIYIRRFGDFWSRLYCDLVFKFLQGSLSFAGIPSVGEQDTDHPVAKLEYLVVLVSF